MTSSQNESETLLSYTSNPNMSHQHKSLIKEKAESLSFTQRASQSNQSEPYPPYETPKTSNISIGIDKDKLYETFILFHNFMYKTQETNHEPHPWYESTIKKKTMLQEKIDQISISKSQVINFHSEEKNPTEVTKSSLSAISKRNYDDIPIKSTNGNFIDLVEKNLLIDKPDENSDNNTNKKIIKKAKTKEKMTRSTPKFYKAYQKPYYALTEEGHSNKKYKQTNEKRVGLYKYGNNNKREKQTPRR